MWVRVSVMAERRVLTDVMWGRLEPLLPGREPVRGGRWRDHREVVEAIIWRFRTGSPWRDLPADLPPWQTVWYRFDRWSKDGRWSLLFEALRVDPDDEWHSLDSTINRAHQHAAGAKGGAHRTGSGARAEVLRRRCTSSSMRLGCR